MDLRHNDLEFDKQVSMVLAMPALLVGYGQSFAMDHAHVTGLSRRRASQANRMTVVMRKSVLKAEEGIMKRDGMCVIQVMSHAAEVTG